MSDITGPGELPAGGNTLGANVNVNLPSLDRARQQVSALTAALGALKDALRDLGSNGYMLSNGINSMLDSIATKASQTTANLGGLSKALSGVGSSGGTAGMPSAPTGGAGNSSYVGAANASAGAAIAAAGGGGGGVAGGGAGIGPSGMDFTGSMGLGTSGKGLMQDMLMFPLRFMRDTISTNRQTALTTSAAMSMNAFATGNTSQNIMTQLSRFPGSVLGQPSDLLSLFGQAPGYGAAYGFGSGANAPRAGGFLAGVRQAQMMNPGSPVGEIAQTIGGFASNTGAQQQAQMMTGGSFGMIKPGGGQKTLSEWAESILRWLEGLRGGKERGKPFDYGQLMAQYFPGSNIDAWFEANGVPQNMREYWWTYALGKTKSTGSSQGDFSITPEAGSVAWNRLQATSSITQTQFGMAGTMSGAYANKEISNRWFNDVLGSFQQKVIPSAVSSGPLNFMQYTPDTIEQLLMTALERSGKFGAIAGGTLGYAGLLDTNDQSGSWGNPLGSMAGAEWLRHAPGVGGLFGNDNLWNAPLTAGLSAGWNSVFGDIGDVGYGTQGATSAKGMRPDVRAKVEAMQAANPRLRVNSGLRDNAMQQRLKKRGVGRVSGKPSAHTRGEAADMGPASEYGWLAANAAKFGLVSGAGKGEPWHVGVGDIGDDNDFVGFMGGALDILGGFKDLIAGTGHDQSIAGLGKLLPGLFTMLGGAIAGKGEVSTDALAFRGPKLYELLYGASKEITTGGIIASGSTGSYGATGGSVGAGGGGSSGAATTTQTSQGRSTAGSASGWSGKAWVGTNPSGRGDRYSQAASAQIMQLVSSADPVDRGAGIAMALSNAGFSGQELQNFMRISYRESGWTTNKWVEGAVDTGGGILGVNQLPWTSKGKPAPYTMADILDPQASANIARDMYLNVSPVNGPGGSNTYKPWTVNGNWQGGIPSEAAGLAQQAIARAGVGDIEDYPYLLPQSMGTGQRGNTMQFNNNFVISGGGGGGGGIDLRRTVTTIADHLEAEMNKRLVRTG